jgi:hypothetical protein
MKITMHGGFASRRQRTSLCVTLIALALAGCANTPAPEARAGPTACSRGSARPANPHGSVFQNAATVQATPEQAAAANAAGGGVIVFDNPTASPAVPSGQTVPPLQFNGDAGKPAARGADRRRTTGARSSAPRKSAAIETEYRSC